MKSKIDEFYKIAQMLNEKLGIIPLLYGSLGLQQLIDIDLCPDDIDILVPEIFINENWEKLKNEIEKCNYELVDLHEHEFLNNGIKIAFSYIEDLIEYAGINIDEIIVLKNNNANYKILNLRQYLKVYEQSIKDSYRSDKNNRKDYIKIKIIKEKIG